MCHRVSMIDGGKSYSSDSKYGRLPAWCLNAHTTRQEENFHWNFNLTTNGKFSKSKSAYHYILKNFSMIANIVGKSKIKIGEYLTP